MAPKLCVGWVVGVSGVELAWVVTGRGFTAGREG